MALEEELGDLQTALVVELRKRIRDGSATAADLSVARQFLKDNGIQAKAATGSPMGDLVDSLPFPVEDMTDAPFN